MKTNATNKELDSFLRAMPYLNKLSDTLILSLSKRFSLNKQHFAQLIEINALNRGLNGN